ncbi:MAG: fibronectin type III domain-containing protein [Eubacterium sp.]
MKNYVKAIVTFIFLMAAVAFVPTTSKAALSAPINLKQTGASESSVDFTWDTVIGAYDYYSSISDGMTWSEPERVYDSKESIYKLSAGKTYYVKVYAIDKNGVKGPESAPFEVVTAPDANEVKTTVTAVTENAISFSWTPATGATSYDITSRYDNIIPNLSVTDTSATLANLAPSTWYGFNVVPCRTSSSGYKAVYSYAAVEYTQTAGTSLPTQNTGTVLTAPATPSKADFGIYTVSTAASTVTFQANDPNRTANGYEVEVRNLKGKVVKTISSTSTYSTATKFAKNTPYKYRIRLFSTNGVQKMYSGWSGYRYFWLNNVTGKKHYSYTNSYAKIKLHWPKVSGAKGYTVSMSTSKDGKYKKVKSLSKKAKSVTLTKYGKKKLNKNKTYYIKVVAKIKDGKKTVSNDAQMVNYNY